MINSRTIDATISMGDTVVRAEQAEHFWLYQGDSSDNGTLPGCSGIFDN